MDITRYDTLIKEFKKVPSRKPIEQTYLEIAGYPYLENVASNFLEFFLDPEREHGFITTCLEALLDASGQTWMMGDLQEVEVSREAVTDSNSRIDLVITTEALVIGIENKLYAAITNDFSDYRRHLEQEADGRRIIPILLTLFPIKPSPDFLDFIPITYEDFFNQLTVSMGRPLIGANQRYVPLLFDFISTIENLRKGSQMENKNFRLWIRDNQQDVEDLWKQVRNFKSQLRERIQALGSLIDLDRYANTNIKIDQWLYNPPGGEIKRVLVHDIKVSKDLPIAIDTELSPSGWLIVVLLRKGSVDTLKNWFTENGVLFNDYDRSPNRILYGDIFDYHSKPDVIAPILQGLIDRIIVSANSGNIVVGE